MVNEVSMWKIIEYLRLKQLQYSLRFNILFCILIDLKYHVTNTLLS